MRWLHVVQNFRQGQGGAPESSRLMARKLARWGVRSDAFNGNVLFEQIERMDLLPESDEGRPAFDARRQLVDYDAILIIGPWQRVGTLLPLLRQADPRHRIVYLPRGGLADGEFAGLRNLKKHVYYPLVEARVLRRANAIVLSSALEATGSSRLSAMADKHAIIPDMFDAPAPLPRDTGEQLRLSFLAEIDPRKGVHELVAGLQHWEKSMAPGEAAEVVIAGGPRPGREPYLEAARAAAQSLERVDVRFPGALAHRDRAAFYAATDIFLVTSQFESYCLTALEALTSGCILVCAPGVGVLEYLPDHPGIVRADSLSPSAIAEAIERARAWRKSANYDRAALIEFVAGPVSRINEQAEGAWLALLGGRDQGAAEGCSQSFAGDRVRQSNGRRHT